MTDAAVGGRASRARRCRRTASPVVQLPPVVAAEHQAAVAALRESYAALPAGAPVRLAKRTSNLFRFRDPRPRPRAAAEPGSRAPSPGLDVSAFTRVLHVDPPARAAVVGGMTTYEDLADATLRHGLMPLVVPQLKTITLGGAVTGLGIESTSLRNGLPHESVTAMEILTGDGRVVTATAEGEHADLFRGFPNSYGTLGYALSLTIELEPVAPFVHLRHFAYTSPQACMDAIAQIAADGSLHGHRADFVDGTAFGLDEIYLTVGAYSDVAPWRSDYTGQRIYYQSVRGPARGLPHHPRLPVALGHRLVLVLAAVRRAAPGDTQALAAPLPAVRCLPVAGRLRPPAWAVRHAQRQPRAAAARGGDPGRGDSRGPRCRVPALLRGRGGHEPGVAVPVAAAQRQSLAAVPAEARRGVCELRLLGDGAAATRTHRRVPQPPGRGGGDRPGRPQGAVFDVVLLRGRVLGRLQRPRLCPAQERLRRRRKAVRAVREVRARQASAATRAGSEGMAVMALAKVFEQIAGPDAPVEFRAYDGSEAGVAARAGADHDPLAGRGVLHSPGAGLARPGPRLRRRPSRRGRRHVHRAARGWPRRSEWA